MTLERPWSISWNLDEDKTRLKLKDLGVQIGDNARTLPKGALKKLRKSYDTLSPPNQSDAAIEVPFPATPAPEFVFRTSGHRRDVDVLTADEILKVHGALVDGFAQSADPIEPPGVRDLNLPESAAFRPATALGDELKYPTVEMAGAALLHSLVLNHAFYNGNKRELNS